MLSSVATLQASITQITSLGGAVATAEAALTQAQAQFNLGHITQDVLNQITSVRTAAQSALSSVTSAIRTHTQQISNVMHGIDGAIHDAQNFVNEATTKLTTFTSALKLNALFKDPCIRSVLGAVSSASTLSKLI